MRYYEKNQRSIAKSITFRMLVICSDLMVIFTLTHRYDVTIGITILTNLASTFLYYFHERMWNLVHWGKTKVN